MTTGEMHEAASPARVRTRRRVLSATIISASIEWYDFIVYGTAASLIFGREYFPSMSHTAGILASLATFTIGFAARPVGGAVFGHIGDRYGRKPALLVGILLMAVSSVLIGVVPNYATIGVAAPLILVVLRLGQGIAIGGQWGGATLLSIEHGPSNRRGLYGAIPQLGIPVGLVVGNLIFLIPNQLLNNSQFDAWGWRVPFLFTAVLFPIAFYIQRYIHDTPEFQHAEDNQTETRRGAPRSSAWEVLRRPRQVILITITYTIATLYFYVITTALVTYATQDLQVSASTMLATVLLSMIGWTAGTMGLAWLSDVTGHRRRFYAVGAIGAGAWGFAIFPLVQTRSFPLIVLAAVVGMFFVGVMYGPGVPMMAEMFPARVRYAGASLGYQLANILGAGVSPLATVALLAATGTTLSISGYVALFAAISLIPLAMIKLPAPTPEAAPSMPSQADVS